MEYITLIFIGAVIIAAFGWWLSFVLGEGSTIAGVFSMFFAIVFIAGMLQLIVRFARFLW